MHGLHPTRPASAPRVTSAALLVLLCGLGLAGAGCHRNIAKASSRDAFRFSWPIPIPPAIPHTDEQLIPLPQVALAPETPGPASLIVPPPRLVPPRPHPENADSSAPKPEAPQLSPQLSPAELAGAEQQTQKDISTAENNLQLAYGKRLNASQSDLAEKIRGFLGQAREAIRAADWVRARNLAQKARVLSLELIHSL